MPYERDLVIKQYGIDGAIKNLDEILEEYRQARRGERSMVVVPH